MPLEQAVIDAGAVRFRPMLLTAAAVVVGAAVILFDPIFQGLAIALMAGEVASLALSRMTVPIVYFVVNRRRKDRMTVERYLRLIAGFFVMLSVALGYWVQPVLVSVHRVRRAEPVPVGVHQLVPHDDVPEETGRARVRPAQAPRRRLRLLDFRDPGNLF